MSILNKINDKVAKAYVIGYISLLALGIPTHMVAATANTLKDQVAVKIKAVSDKIMWLVWGVAIILAIWKFFFEEKNKAWIPLGVAVFLQLASVIFSYGSVDIALEAK